MRLLITGVSGFVGRALAATLQTRGHAVGGTYVELSGPELAIDLFRADLLDIEALSAAVQAFRPDRVVHLAGLSHVGRSFEAADEYHRVNATGTENLVRVAAGVPIVLASSSEVYGCVPEDEQPISELREPAPRSPYAESKLAAEKLVLATGGLIVRCFNVFGPGQAPMFALPSFARQLAEIHRGEAEPVLRVGNLAVWRDFTYRDDAADAYAVLIERAELGTIYNLGSGRARRLGDLLDRLIEISGLQVRVETHPEKFRPVDAALQVADVGRLHGLGWRPTRDLDQALTAIWQDAIS